MELKPEMYGLIGVITGSLVSPILLQMFTMGISSRAKKEEATANTIRNLSDKIERIERESKVQIDSLHEENTQLRIQVATMNVSLQQKQETIERQQETIERLSTELEEVRSKLRMTKTEK